MACRARHMMKDIVITEKDMSRRPLAVALAWLVAAPAFAADNIDQVDLLAQQDFRALSEDMAAALSYKAIVPTEPLGITGFDVGVEVTATELQHPDSWDRASSGSTPATVYIPKLHLHKGLPGGFDVGAFYANAAGSNIDLWGAEVRYAIIQGGTAMPALGLRGTYSRLSGVEQLDFTTRGVELGVSKGFAFVTPYAGVGRVWVDSEPRVATLEAENFSETKYYAGFNFNFVLGDLALEGDRTGDATSYSAKLGFRF